MQIPRVISDAEKIENRAALLKGRLLCALMKLAAQPGDQAAYDSLAEVMGDLQVMGLVYGEDYDLKKDPVLGGLYCRIESFTTAHSGGGADQALRLYQHLDL